MSAEIVKSSKRVMEILEAFDRTKRAMSLNDVVKDLDYPVSSAAALLKSLVALGYLSYDAYSRTYLPTTRIATLGNWIWESVVDEKTLRLMEKLSRMNGETVTLSTLSGVNVQYVHVLPSALPLRYDVAVGFRRPVFVSSTGWALLSALSDGQIEELVRQVNFHEVDKKKKVPLAAMIERVDSVRRNGYAFSKHLIVRGGGSIATLLPEAAFQRRFAVGIHGVVEHLEQREAAIARTMLASTGK